MDATNKEEGNSDLNSPLIVGRITQLEGVAKIISADGSTRVLHTGDPIYLGDKLQIPGNGVATIQLVNGAIYNVPPGSPITFDPNTLKHITAQAFPEETPNHHGTLMAYHGEMSQVNSGFLTHPCGFATPGHSLVVGTVNCAEGFVTAVGADGATRILTAGDPVYSGDVITTTADSTAKIQMNNGGEYNVQPGDTFTGATEEAGACASSEDAYEPGIELTYLPASGETGFVSSGFDTGNFVNVAPVPIEVPVAPPVLIPPPIIPPPVIIPPPTPVPDLSIVKSDTSGGIGIPGTAETFTLKVSNTGMGDALNSTLTDNIPTGFTVNVAATQAAAAAEGATFNLTGGVATWSGFDVAPNSNMTFDLIGTINSNYNASTLSNTAGVDVPAGDTTPGNNTSTDTLKITPEVDLAVTKTDGVTSAVPGTTDTYTIVVSNNGPSNVIGGSVSDIVPATLTNASWTVTGTTGGATDTSPTGTGNISDSVDIPVGGSITYTLTGTIAPSATGSISNTATASAGAGETDTNTANNSATDTDTLTPQVDLAVTKTDGVTSAVPGTADTYTIVVSNNGPSDVVGGSVSDIVPAALTNASWSVTGTTGGATDTSPTGTGNISDSVDIPVGGSITYTLTGTIASSATGSISNTATASAGAGETDTNTANNSATDTDTLTPQVDLAVTKTDGVTSAVPGTADTYTIVVSNNGPSDVVGGSVSDIVPAALTNASWSVTGTTGGATDTSPTGTGNISDSVDIPVGGSITYTLTGTIASSATGSISNTATASAGAGETDTNTANNSATDTDTLTPQVDLAVTKTDGVTSAVPGTADTYTIVVSNNGPSDVVGGSVSDIVPAALTNASWSVTGTTGGATDTSPTGTGNISDSVDIPVGGSITYTLTGTIASSATGSISNTATASAGAGETDTNTANNSATDTDTLTPQVDLAVTKTDGVTSAVPGTADTYTIVVSNNGPSDVVGGSVSDIVPAALTNASWSVTGTTGGATDTSPTGTGNISDSVDIPVGGSITYSLTGTIASSATGSISNTATASAGAGETDTNTANNSATDTDTLTPQVDLAVTKTDGVTSAVPGTADTYTIVVSNNGPSDVVGGSVSDIVPAALTNASWSVTGTTGGATDTSPTGTGNISDSVDIPVGGSITYTLTGTIASSATGSISNTATASAGAGETDTNTANNSATDTDTLTPQVDLAVTKTDGVTSAVPGTADTYTIVVSNNGPSDVVGGSVSDIVPAALTNASWSVTGTTGGATDTSPTGTGNISDSVDIPVGGSITYTLTGTIASSATGSISNTATASAGAGETDTNTANNSATDTDTLTPQVDLAVTKTDGVTSAVPGTADTYTIVVSNNGPSDVVGGSVSDIVPAALTNASWSVTGTTGGATDSTPTGTGNISDSVDIPVGGSITYTLTGTIASSATGSISNTATASAGTGETDTNTANNSATDTDTLTPQVDLAVTKTDGVTSVVPGTSDTYTIVVSNNGPSDVVGGSVSDIVPAALTNASWSVTGTTGGATDTSPTGTGNISDSVDIPVGGSITYSLTGTIASSATGSISNTATVSAGAGETDTNTANNSATDTDTLTPTADLTITKTDNVGGIFDSGSNNTSGGSAVPGTSEIYTVVVSNSGPSDVSGATVQDILPSGINGDSWSATFTGGANIVGNVNNGTGNINDSVNLPAGSTITYTIDANVASSQETMLGLLNNAGSTTDVQNAWSGATLYGYDFGQPYESGGTLTLGTPQLVAYNVGGVGVSGTDGYNLPGPDEINHLANDNSSSADSQTLVVALNNSASSATVEVNAMVYNEDNAGEYGEVTAYNASGQQIGSSIVFGNANPTVAAAFGSDFVPVNYNSISSGSTDEGTFTITSQMVGGDFSYLVFSALPYGAGVLGNSISYPDNDSSDYLVQSINYTQANLINTATVTPPAGEPDPNLSNNSSTDTQTFSPVADLSITKTDSETIAVPGMTETYTIVVTNNGPSAVMGASVMDALASNPNITSDTWTATGTSGAGSFSLSGSGNINDTVNLQSGASITYTVTADISPSATGTLSNTATVEPPSGTTDNNPGNNSSTVTNLLDPQADLTIEKTDNVGGVFNSGTNNTTGGSVIPGDSEIYTIVVSNNGPSTVTGGSILDSLPAGIASDSWTAVTSGGALITAGGNSGTGNISNIATLPTGSTITYTIDANVSPSAIGSLVTTAIVAPPAGVTDTNPANNSSTDTQTLIPTADLSITKTDGVTSAVPGTPDTYTIVVTNSGPSNVVGGSVSDIVPSTLTGATWHVTGTTGGATDTTSSGTGNISDSVNIPTGGSITYTLTGTIASSATGSISNTATVSAGAGETDTNTANNSATDTDTLTPKVDLAITKTDGVTSIVPGTPDTYTIVVTNSGPSNVVGGSVSDIVPSTLTGATWHVTGTTGGATDTTSSGTGNISDSVNIPTGGSITYTLTGTIASSATGSISNTATVSAGAGETDTNTANNSATDTDTLTPKVDLAITKTDGVTSIVPGTPDTYTIVVTNSGPSNVVGGSVSDIVPSTLTGATWHVTGTTGGATDTTSSGTGNISDSVNIPTGGSITYSLTGTIASSATGSISNTATVSAGAGETDTNTANNSATDTDTLTPQADLTIKKTDNVGGTFNSGTNNTTGGTVIPGHSEIYTVVVSNTGPSAVTGATIQDLLPSGIGSDSWTAAVSGGALITAGNSAGSGNIIDTATLPVGSTITYTINANVSAGATGTLSNTATVTAPSGVTDTNHTNNSSTDTQTLTPHVDLTIAKTDNVGGTFNSSTNDTTGGSVAQGGTEIYTVVVSNTGPSNATGATVSDIIPAGISSDHWSAVLSGGATITSGGSSSTGNINDTVNLPSGSSITYTIDATIGSNQTMVGLLNNASSSSDVQAAWSGATLYGYDIGHAYTSSGVLILGTPNQLVAYNTNGVGVSGTDNMNLQVPDEINHEANTSSNPLDSQTLVVGLNNSASSATIEVNNLYYTEDNNAGEYGVVTAYNASGHQVGSTIVFGNANASVESAFGSDFVPVNYNAVTNGSTDQGTFTITSQMVGGDFSYLVFSTLPYGAGVIPGTVYPNNDSSDYYVQSINYTNANLVNTATVTAPSGVTDTNTSNNSSSDTTTVTPTADLTILNQHTTPSEGKPGTSESYQITVSNTGPSEASDTTVKDVLPSGFTMTSSEISAAQSQANTVDPGTTFSASTSGGVTTLTWSNINLSNQTVLFDFTGNISNSYHNSTLVSTATIIPEAGVTDSNPTTTSTDTLTMDPDVAIKVTDNVGGVFNPGTNNTTGGSTNSAKSEIYTVVVSNNGPANATGATVSDLLPASISSDSWTAVLSNGASINGGIISGTGNINEIVNLAVGSTITFTINANVEPSATGNLVNTATVMLPPGVDPNLNNNTATDTTTLNSHSDLNNNKPNDFNSPLVTNNGIFDNGFGNNGNDNNNHGKSSWENKAGDNQHHSNPINFSSTLNNNVVNNSNDNNNHDKSHWNNKEGDNQHNWNPVNFSSNIPGIDHGDKNCHDKGNESCKFSANGHTLYSQNVIDDYSQHDKSGHSGHNVNLGALLNNLGNNTQGNDGGKDHNKVNHTAQVNAECHQGNCHTVYAAACNDASCHEVDHLNQCAETACHHLHAA